MSRLFWNAKSFNQPLQIWKVSHVTLMILMIAGASVFNQLLEE
jgi:hypothetical protein